MARNAALRCSLVWLLVVLQMPASGQRQPRSIPLGQVVAETVEVDGIAVPSGTTLMSGNVIETRESPASIHLTGLRVIQLAANSKAKAEAGSGGAAVKITLQAGTLSMRSDSGEAITVPAERVLYFPQQGSKAGQTPSPRDVVAVLQIQAEAGNKSITVNDTSKIDASQPIVIKRSNADVGEVHYIRSIQGNVIALTAPLTATFPAQSLVLQGETTRAVLSEPPKTGQPQPGARPAGKSNARTIGLVAGIGGAAAAGLIIFAAGKSDTTSPPASPSQP